MLGEMSGELQFSDVNFLVAKLREKRDEEGLVMEDLLLAKSISSYCGSQAKYGQNIVMFLYETCFHPRASKAVVNSAARCLCDILGRWDLPALYLYTKRLVRLFC